MTDKFDIPVPKNHRSVKSNGSTKILKLLWAELEYDVKYDLWKRSQFLKASGEDLKQFKITDKDTDWLLRTFFTAIENVKMKLLPYLEENNFVASDELLDKPSEYNISLHFDNGWRGNSLMLLNCVHNYVTNFAISEWLLKGGSDLGATYLNVANSYANQAYSIANTYNLEETPKFIL